MREQPDGAQLLAIARAVLKQSLLPLLPKDQHYNALMIINAMSIAERQLDYGQTPQQAERVVLCQLLAQDDELPDLNHAFARAIRSGVMDDNEQAHRLLWQTTLQRVRESAPKALVAYGLK
jgi:hypothetical protein